MCALICLVLPPLFDHANVEVHMLVQAGSEAVDEGDCAYVPGRPVCIGGTGDVGLQGLPGFAH